MKLEKDASHVWRKREKLTKNNRSRNVKQRNKKNTKNKKEGFQQRKKRKNS